MRDEDEEEEDDIEVDDREEEEERVLVINHHHHRRSMGIVHHGQTNLTSISGGSEGNDNRTPDENSSHEDSS